MKNNLKDQALEIINKNGACPQEILGGCDCNNCIYPKITGKVSECNPSSALQIAKEYIANENLICVALLVADDGQSSAMCKKECTNDELE